MTSPAFILACALGWFFGQAVGAHFFPSYVHENAVLVWIAGGCIVGLPVYGAGSLITHLIELDLSGHTSVFVRRPVGWIFRGLVAVIPCSLAYGAWLLFLRFGH